MDRLPYFPFPEDGYRMKMDAAALAVDRLIEIDERYRGEVGLKEEILATDDRYYCHAPVSTLPLQWDVVELLLPNMARHYPDQFTLEIEGSRWRWANRLLATESIFTLGDADTLPLPPLDWIARQVQEDLLLMEGTPGGSYALSAGHLCFAAKWCLDDNIGLPLLSMHDVVPGFREKVGAMTEALMSRIKPGRPVGRVNWGIATTDRLNLSPLTAHEWKPTAQGITPENAGERCFLRLERQTLSRLPHTGGILFTVRTYVNPIRELAVEPEKLRRFVGVLRTLPPEMRAYKGIAPFYNALLGYLNVRLQDDKI